MVTGRRFDIRVDTDLPVCAEFARAETGGQLTGSNPNTRVLVAHICDASHYLTLSTTLKSMYGSMGAVVVLMIWLYVSGAAILIGGELNSVIWRAVGGKSLEETARVRTGD